MQLIWLLIFVYSYIDVYQGDKLNTDKKTIKNCLIMAASIGLGYLSKPSVVIGMVILLILLLVRCIKRKDGIKNIFHILAIGSAGDSDTAFAGKPAYDRNISCIK